jgi:hypothetical protein
MRFKRLSEIQMEGTLPSFGPKIFPKVQIVCSVKFSRSESSKFKVQSSKFHHVFEVPIPVPVPVPPSIHEQSSKSKSPLDVPKLTSTFSSVVSTLNNANSTARNMRKETKL